MKCQRQLLQIKWHQIVRNEYDANAATTGLPSISETISRRRNVARLPDDVPAHKALNCQVNLSLGRPPSSQWHRRPGRPRSYVTDGLTRSGMTTTYHLRISGGALSIVVIRYGPCWLNDDNNKTAYSYTIFFFFYFYSMVPCRWCPVSTTYLTSWFHLVLSATILYKMQVSFLHQSTRGRLSVHLLLGLPLLCLP